MRIIDIDKWSEIVDTLFRHKLRTSLTALGVGWGIFMLVLLLGAGKGLQNGVEYNFRDDAVNSLWVYGGQTSIAYKGMPVGRQIQFQNQDYDALENIDGVEYKSGRYYLRGESITRYKNKSSSYNTRCVHPDHKYLEGTIMDNGRFINQTDLDKKRKVVVIGKLVAKELFEEFETEPAFPVGKWITIGDIPFQVVGVFSDAGNEREMQYMYLPITTAQLAFNANNKINQLMMTVGNASVEESNQIAKNIQQDFAKRHKFSPEDDRAVRVRNNVEEFEKFQMLFLFIRGFVWVVSLMTILAGIIGVSNIMLIIVKERTKEIGIRKALGATPYSIVSLIVSEAIVITSVAGFFGLTLGVGAIMGMKILVGDGGGGDSFFRNPEVDLYVVLVAIGLLVISGALAGFFPAYRAAKIAPIVALRAD
ncbi:ABC transporter permease [Bernardetia sp.]|uniref:ABC transporter permease n=1 Tax=Bernardetia sp. TaxID=1937974 RepID=UPI0025C6649F|nr:ABC transporter permease [Bernardetia sp.]